MAQVMYVTGSSQKICQLTGQRDRQLGQPTLNRTERRFGLIGTDLGFSFEHNGYCHFIHRAVQEPDRPKCADLADPHQLAEWGGEYGPYVISRYATGDASETTIYWVMSTYLLQRGPHAFEAESRIGRVRVL